MLKQVRNDNTIIQIIKSVKIINIKNPLLSTIKTVGAHCMFPMIQGIFNMPLQSEIAKLDEITRNIYVL